MARIAVGSWMIRYPLGGNLSWTLQWLVGFQKLGHDVRLVEKAGYDDACFDPVRNIMSDDCSYGTAVVDDLLRRFGLERRWCFVDRQGHYHGLPRQEVEAFLRTADLFVDIGTHGAWLDEASEAGARVYVDGEPGAFQMKLAAGLARGEPAPPYDHYFTNGANIGTRSTTAPDAGLRWHRLYNPVVVDLHRHVPAPPDAPFTTVMNWQAHAPLTFEGRVYGQKDVEFTKFLALPQLVRTPLEVAVAGNVPTEVLTNHKWRIRSAHDVTVSYDGFIEYLESSAGEFSVCKNVYVATRTGWFSDRSAAYLACGRPVVLQDTGFSRHLPCGDGLFAVETVAEAVDALSEIEGKRSHHEQAARDLAFDALDARVVLGEMLEVVGL